MASLARFARRFLLLKLLRVGLLAGATFDLALAAALTAAPEVSTRALRLPLPEERFYLWQLAVPLVMLALLQGIAAYDSRRYSGVIAVTIGGRLLGALQLGAAASSRADLAGLVWLAAGDLALGGSLAACWWPLRR